MRKNAMGLKRRKKSFLGPNIVISFAGIVFFAFFIILGLYSEANRGKPTTELFKILVIFIFVVLFVGIVAYAIWSSHIKRNLSKATESKKLYGKVFIRDRSTAFGYGVPLQLIYNLVPASMQVGDENQADFIIETDWSEGVFGTCMDKGSGKMLNVQGKQRYCRIDIFDRRAVYINEYCTGSI